IAKLKQEIPILAKTKNNRIRRFDTENLKHPEIATKFEQEIAAKLRAQQESEDTESEWNTIETIITRTMKKYVDKKNKHVHKDWFDEDCRLALEERNRARLNLLNNATESNKRNLLFKNP